MSFKVLCSYYCGALALPSLGYFSSPSYSLWSIKIASI